MRAQQGTFLIPQNQPPERVIFHKSSLKCNSFNCFGSATEGAPPIRSRAAWFLGNNKIEIRGKGAVKFLQSMCDNNLDKPVGSIVYTQMLNPRGGIECDFTVTRVEEERFLIITGTAFGVHDMSWIRLHMPEDGSVIMQDVTSQYACIGLWGPKARTILQKVTKLNVSNESFPYMTMQQIAVGDVPVMAMRVTYVGELGWEFYCPMEYGLALYDTLLKAGEAEGIVPAGYRAIDSLRLEKGYRYWGADISPDYTPYETGQAFCVNLDKGDFIGREAILKQIRDERKVVLYVACRSNGNCHWQRTDSQ